jgi:hypothetical protein
MDRTTTAKLIKDYIMWRVCLDREQRVNPTQLIPVLDDTNETYAMIASGWEGARWAQDLMLFIRLNDDKILIESDYTATGITDYLIENGVPEVEIVLSWLPDWQPMTKQEAA